MRGKRSTPTSAFQVTFQVSCVRACRLAQFSRAAWYRRSRARDQSALRLRIQEIAHIRPRFGGLRMWVLLRREGCMVNRKRVRRLYRLDGLQVRMRVRRRKHMAVHRGPAPLSAGPTERWSMDFVHDALADGRPFRVLTVVDHLSHHSPVLEVASHIVLCCQEWDPERSERVGWWLISEGDGEKPSLRGY